MLSLSGLKKAGFTKTGTFYRSDGIVTLSDGIPEEAGIYLFVVGGKIRYVGKTERSLRRRLRDYEKGLRKDLPRRSVHKGILKTIDTDEIVMIYTFAIEAKKQFFTRRGLPVDYLVGLEAGLIERLDDGNWNPFGSAIRAKRAKIHRDL